MASLLIRNLDEETKSHLRLLAAQRGRSMEQEAREILRKAVQPPDKPGFAKRINERFAKLNVQSLPIPPRTQTRIPPEF